MRHPLFLSFLDDERLTKVLDKNKIVCYNLITKLR